MSDNHANLSIETLGFTLDEGLGQRARIGLIVLQSDQTIEHEFAALVKNSGIALYHARIRNSMDVSPGTLQQMEYELPQAAALLPPLFNFDVIGYGCTSGATMIGEERVDHIIRQIHLNAKTSNPITACKAAFESLGVVRIALLTPYPPEVTSAMQENLRAAGLQINAVASFNQPDDFTVARICSQSILDAVLKVGANENCDGVFVSCTSLRALGIIADAEAQLGKPVISSNQVLAWHLMRQAGLADTHDQFGQIFK